MAMSIQFHKFEGIPKHDHNVRSIEEAHIRGEDEGGFYKILKDCDWKNEVDNVIFKNDIADFNAKQTRKDRLKNSYYDECKERENKDEERKILKKSQGQNDYNVFRPVHEFILGFYGDDINVKEKEKLIEKYVEDFEKKYSTNLKIVGAYIHGDEQKGLIEKGLKNINNIDLHLHLDVVPIAHGYKRGMENQISLSGALKELGFENTNKKENSLVDFESRQREELKKILNKDRDIPIEIIPTKKEKKIHLEKEKYIAQQENEILKIEHSNLKKEKRLKQREILTIENEFQNKKSELDYYENEINIKNTELDSINNSLDDKKAELEETKIAVDKLEEKGDFLHNQLAEKKEEYELLKKEGLNIKNDIENDLEKDINNIINDNVISAESAKQLVDDIKTALTNAYDRGYKAKEYDKNVDSDRDYVINKEITGLFRENSPLNKLNNIFNTINKNIRELAKEYTNNTHVRLKAKLQKKKEEKKVDKILNNIKYEDYFEIFFDRNGNVTEKSEKFLEQKIINVINGKTDDKDWQKLQDKYFNLDSNSRQELLQYIKKDCLKYLIDYNTPKIEEIKFKRFLYSNGIKYANYGGGLISNYIQMQQQVIEEYEDD